MKSMPRNHLRISGGFLAITLAAGTAFGADQSETTRTTQGAGASQLQQHDVNRSGVDQSRLHDRIGSDESPSASAVKPTDAKGFIKEAMEGNAAEIALAEVAERKAQNAEVKQFASMLLREHRQANELLQPIAQAHGVSTTPSLEAKHRQTLDKLQQASGAEFDKAYMTEMLKDHQKDIQKYQHASQQLKETDVKQYAQNTLPKLRKHMEHARQAALAAGVDPQTISSLTRETSGAMGGTGDPFDTDSQTRSSDEKKDKQD